MFLNGCVGDPQEAFLILRGALWGFGDILGVYVVKGMTMGGRRFKTFFVKGSVCAVRVETLI